jgi:ubiquinone/menaquinone biosynthesis C-methylase UbiE
MRQMFAPVTQALIEDAGIASGNTVLDVATGPGEPALSPEPDAPEAFRFAAPGRFAITAVAVQTRSPKFEKMKS